MSRSELIEWLVMGLRRGALVISVALALLACGARDGIPVGDDAAGEGGAAGASPCPANTTTVTLASVDLSPATLDAYSSCFAPDDASLYGKVWCCPLQTQPDPSCTPRMANTPNADCVTPGYRICALGAPNPDPQRCMPGLRGDTDRQAWCCE